MGEGKPLKHSIEGLIAIEQYWYLLKVYQIALNNSLLFPLSLTFSFSTIHCCCRPCPRLGSADQLLDLPAKGVSEGVLFE